MWLLLENPLDENTVSQDLCIPARTNFQLIVLFHFHCQPSDAEDQHAYEQTEKRCE